MALFNRTTLPTGKGNRRPLLTDYPGNSQYAEAFRNLRANIHFAFMEKSFQSLLISSSGQQEGKTSTVFNLAYTMAQAGKTVLMVDADLRRPMLSRVFSSKGSPGLSGLISSVFAREVKEGRLGQDEMGFADLLRLLDFQKRTGWLRLFDDTEKVTLGFFKGEMIDLVWHTRPEEKKLAHSLVRDKILSQDQARAALLRQKDSGQKLGAILMHTGLMSPDDLKGLLAIHMMEGLRCALNLKQACYRFKSIPEADMQRPAFNPIDFVQLYRELMVGEEPLDFLQNRIDDAIVACQQPNMFLLPAGKLPPNPSELLGAERTTFLFDRLRRGFDRILIDSPPILPASDALLLAPRTDGVVLVVKAGMLNREPIRAVVEQLRTTQARLIGVVLNQVDHKKEGYYKYYHKYYQGYYGRQE